MKNQIVEIQVNFDIKINNENFKLKTLRLVTSLVAIHDLVSTCLQAISIGFDG